MTDSNDKKTEKQPKKDEPMRGGQEETNRNKHGSADPHSDDENDKK